MLHKNGETGWLDDLQGLERFYLGLTPSHFVGLTQSVNSIDFGPYVDNLHLVLLMSNLPDGLDEGVLRRLSGYFVPYEHIVFWVPAGDKDKFLDVAKLLYVLVPGRGSSSSQQDAVELLRRTCGRPLAYMTFTEDGEDLSRDLHYWRVHFNSGQPKSPDV